MDEKTCIRCDEDERSAATLLCTDKQREACTVGVDPIDKALAVVVRVGDEVMEFSEPVAFCPWCGREL